jgi:hypothetical protein
MGSHLLGLTLSGGEVHHHDPLHLECWLASRRRVWLNCGSSLLAGELASPWCYLFLSGELPSVDLCLLPPLTSVTFLKRDAGFQLWRRHTRGNRRCSLSGWSVPIPRCGCDRSEQSPMPHLLGEGRPKLPSPLGAMRNSSVESPIMVPMKRVPMSHLLGKRLRPLM